MTPHALDYANAVDWRQPAATPRTPYQIGFDDARYGDVYYNPYLPTSLAHDQYDAGHEDGTQARQRASEYGASGPSRGVPSPSIPRGASLARGKCGAT